MNQEEEVKKAGVQKKPMRTFGEDDLNVHHGKPVIGTGMTTATSVKKVDRAIQKTAQSAAAPTVKTSKPIAKPIKEETGEEPQKAAKSAKAPKTAAAAAREMAQVVLQNPEGTDQPQSKAKTSAKKVDPRQSESKKFDPKKSDAAEKSGKSTAKKKSASSKKKGGKKGGKKSGKGQTFIRIGHGIRTGSVSLKRYVKGGMSWFDRFVAGEANITPPKGDEIIGALGKRLLWIKKMGFSSFIIGSILLMAVLLTFFNNTSIAVENVDVSIAGLNGDLEGYTICLISDLHGREFGTEQATLLRAVNGEDYDLMLITGDMVGKNGDPQPFYDFLDGLSGNKPVYFIAGDSDPGPLRDKPNVVEGMLEEFVLEDWILGAAARGAIYLDSPESLTVDEAVIWLTPESMLNVESSSTLSSLNKQVYQETNDVLAGMDSGYERLPFSSYFQQNMTQLQERILEMETDDLHISVAHIPPYSAPRVSDGSDGYLPTVDLMVAGHYCGGVWKLPLIGAVYIPAVEAPRHGWFPSQKDVEGLRMLGGANLYVSGGLGVTDQIYLPDFRFSNQPKVTLLHLTAKLTDDLLGLTD